MIIKIDKITNKTINDSIGNWQNENGAIMPSKIKVNETDLKIYFRKFNTANTNFFGIEIEIDLDLTKGFINIE